MPRQNNRLAYIAAILFSIIVGFSFLGVKNGIDYSDSLHILVHRYNAAFIFLVLMNIIGWGNKKKGKKPKRVIFLIAFFYVFFMVFQTVGLIFSNTIEGALIFAAIPIFSKMIARFLLRERTSFIQNFFMIVTIASLMAMILLSTTNLTINWIGAVLLLVSSIFLSFSNVFMRYVRYEYTPFEVSGSIITFGFLFFNLIAVIYARSMGSFEFYIEPITHWEFVLSSVYLGVFATFISSQLMAYMLSRLDTVKATIFGNVSTVISIIAGSMLLHEPLHTYHWILTSVILLAVVGLSMTKSPLERL